MLSKAAFLLLCLLPGAGAAAAEPRIERVENGLLPAASLIGEPTRTMNLAERMAHYKVPAVSVAVIDNYRIVWTRAYGTLVAGGSAPATAKTLFQAASLSKPVTAAAALTLVADGKMSLDAPLNDVLTSWKIPPSDKADGKPVTLRRILGHTAGFNVHGFRGYAAGERVPTLRQVLDGLPPANSEAIRIVEAPGAGLAYSGGGYVVLQQAIEDATGRSFAEAMRDRLLRPLGMTDSRFAPSLAESLAGRAAVGHTGGGTPLEGRWRSFPELAPAGLWSTPADLARFTLWIMNGVREGAAPAHHAVAAAMLEPQRNRAGRPFTEPSGSKAGLGLVLNGEGETLRFSHSGSNPGQKALIVGFPGTGQGAVIMTSSDTGPGLIQEIMRSLAAEYRWPDRFHKMIRPAPLEPAALEALAGGYKFESRARKGQAVEIVVTAADGALLAALPDGTRHRLRALSATDFLDPATGLAVVFDGRGSLRIPAYQIVARRD
jgi:CubicO group peptidase (beta-lactamase class C family)